MCVCFGEGISVCALWCLDSACIVVGGCAAVWCDVRVYAGRVCYRCSELNCMCGCCLLVVVSYPIAALLLRGRSLYAVCSSVVLVVRFCTECVVTDEPHSILGRL